MNPFKTLLLYTSLTAAAVLGINKNSEAQNTLSLAKQQEIVQAYKNLNASTNPMYRKTIETALGEEKGLYNGSMANLVTAPENGVMSIVNYVDASWLDNEPWIKTYQVGHNKGQNWNAEHPRDYSMTYAIYFNKLLELGKPIQEVIMEAPEIIKINNGIPTNQISIQWEGNRINDIVYTGTNSRKDVREIHGAVNGKTSTKKHILMEPNDANPGGTIHMFPLDDIIWIAYGLNVHGKVQGNSLDGGRQITDLGQSDNGVNVTKGPLTSYPQNEQSDELYVSQDVPQNQTKIDHSGGGLLLGITNRSLLQIGGFIEGKNGLGFQAFYIAPFGSNIVEYEGTQQDRQEMMLGKTGVSEITRNGTAKVSMRTFGADITKTLGNINFGKFPMSTYIITGYRASMLKTDYDYNGDGTERLRTFILDSDGSKQDLDNRLFNLRDTETQKIYKNWLHSVNIGLGFENGPISFAFAYAIPLNSNGFKDDGFVPDQKNFAPNNVMKNSVPQYDGPDSKPLTFGPGNFTFSTKINLGWKNPNRNKSHDVGYDSQTVRQAQGYYRPRR